MIKTDVSMRRDNGRSGNIIFVNWQLPPLPVGIHLRERLFTLRAFLDFELTSEVTKVIASSRMGNMQKPEFIAGN